MIWAVDALCAGRPEAAAPFLTFPQQVTNQTIGSPYVIHPWELETLLVQMFLTRKPDRQRDGTEVFDCSKFESVSDMVNRLRKLENAETAVYLKGGNFGVLSELQRIAQRQFHWQRGYLNPPQFYRYTFMYAQGKCGEYFNKAYGLPIAELSFVAFALLAQSRRSPWLSSTFTIPELALTPDLMKQALPLLLISTDKARDETDKIVNKMNLKHGTPIPTAFLPSIIRRFPLVCPNENADEFLAPIGEALLLRTTAGLYYDLIPGGQNLLNEANDRFEEYCANYIRALMSRFSVRRAYRYEPKKGAAIDTPDLLVQDGDKLVLIAECKATKLTYLAQFAEDPFEAANDQYLQLAKAVFQMWRFFSHVRLGLLAEVVDADTSAIVLTLDSFHTIDDALRAKIIKEANSRADKDGNIVEADRRIVVFCTIEDLEAVVCASTEDGFIATLKATREKKYTNWELGAVHRDQETGLVEPKPYPFKWDELLPWWERAKEFERSKENKQG
jgi:hypothetical protein